MEAYLALYRYDDALKIGQPEGESPTPDARLQWLLGLVYDRLDEFEEAERHFRAANQVDRRFHPARLALARLYHRTRRRLQTQRVLRSLLEQDPTNEEARELLARSYLADRKPDVALEVLDDLRRTASTPLVRARAEALLNQLQRPDVEAYQKALLEAMEQFGEDAKTWIDLAESYAATGEAQKRYDAYQKALALDPDNEQAALGLIESAKDLVRFEEAARRLEAILPRRPNRQQWRMQLIDLYWTIQDFDAALSLAESMENKEDLDARHRRLYRQTIVDTLLYARRDEEAIRRIRTWIEKEPDRDEWQTMLAETYLRLDQPEQAIPILEKRFEENRQWRELSDLLVALTQAKRFERATQYLLDYLGDDPENNAALDRLASVLTAAERFDEAEELVRNRLFHTFAREAFQARWIEILNQAKRYDACLDLIESLIDQVTALGQKAGESGRPLAELDVTPQERILLPDEPFTLEQLQRRLLSLRLTMATIMVFAEQYASAEEQITRWLDDARDPEERFEYLRRLAFVYQRQGRDAESTETLARALALQPDHVGLNNDVAYGWIDQGIRLDEAERMIRYAVARNPRRSAFLDTYGWLLYKKGDFQGAKTFLLRALRMERETDPVVADHLGDACWRLGEKEDAVRYWKQAAEAVKKRSDQPPVSSDERRVRETIRTKIESAEGGRTPSVAPLAKPKDEAQPENGKRGGA